MPLEASSACRRHNNPAFRKASKALAEGKLPMPVLMLYADSDTALGTQLVKVSTHHSVAITMGLAAADKLATKLMLLSAARCTCLVHI